MRARARLERGKALGGPRVLAIVCEPLRRRDIFRQKFHLLSFASRVRRCSRSKSFVREHEQVAAILPERTRDGARDHGRALSKVSYRGFRGNRERR